MLIRWKELIPVGFIQAQEDLHHILILNQVNIFSELKDQTMMEFGMKQELQLQLLFLHPSGKHGGLILFYALIFVFALYGIRQYEMNRLRLKDQDKDG